MTLYKEFKEVELAMIAKLFDLPVDAFATEEKDVNDIEYITDTVFLYGEYKTRCETSTKYPDWILEHRKLNNLVNKLAKLLDIKIGADTEFPTITSILEYAQLKKVKFVYINYFNKDDSIAVWDLIDVLLNKKYTIGSVYAAKTTAADFSGKNKFDKGVYKLTLANAYIYRLNFNSDEK